MRSSLWLVALVLVPDTTQPTGGVTAVEEGRMQAAENARPPMLTSPPLLVRRLEGFTLPTPPLPHARGTQPGETLS